MDYLDANVLWGWSMQGKHIAYLREAVENRQACTSLFTLAEMHYGMTGKGFPKERIIAALEKIVSSSGIRFIPATEEDFLLALKLEERGLKLFDALHAALCLRNGFRLATLDEDFGKIKELQRVQPS